MTDLELAKLVKMELDLAYERSKIPSSQHATPQPAGTIAANWYATYQPNACELLYVVAELLALIQQYKLIALQGIDHDGTSDRQEAVP